MEHLSDAIHINQRKTRTPNIASGNFTKSIDQFKTNEMFIGGGELFTDNYRQRGLEYFASKEKLSKRYGAKFLPQE
jgi:hypothetical protein